MDNSGKGSECQNFTQKQARLQYRFAVESVVTTYLFVVRTCNYITFIHSSAIVKVHKSFMSVIITNYVKSVYKNL